MKNAIDPNERSTYNATNMAKSTKERIMQHAKHVFATRGYEGLSMRLLAKQSGVSLSVTYHYFKNKDALLKELFTLTSHNLGKKRAQDAISF